MNRLDSWRFFHAPERHHHQLSYQLGPARQQLNALNERRMSLQREIDRLTRSCGQACATCGACCMGEYDHFTMVDVLIRMFSARPVHSYGEIWKPKPLYRLFLDIFRPSSQGTVSGKQVAGCPHLTPRGCDLQVEDRPIRCTLWTCREFREAILAEDQSKVGRLMVELDGLSVRALELLTGRLQGRAER